MDIGIIGSGNIVPFHIAALKASGFSIKGISASLNSKSAQQMAVDYEIPLYFDSSERFFESCHLFDALLLAPKSEFLFPLFRRAIDLKIPTLVEKPLFITYDQIDEFEAIAGDFDKVLVGYNRRFYKTIMALREEIRSRGLLKLRMSAPELSSSRKISIIDKRETILNNTVHMLDLFMYLTESSLMDLKIQVGLSNFEKSIIQIDSKASRLDIVFGFPGNYSIEVFTLDGGIFELKPLEKLLEFEGMKVIDPDSVTPVRRYIPKVKKEIDAYEGLQKPGFLGQAKALKSLAEGATTTNESSSLQNAANVSRLALKLSHMII